MPDSLPPFERWIPGGSVDALAGWDGFDEPSPLESLPVTGDIEQDDAVEASTVLSTLQTVRNAIGASMDAAYMVPLVFVSREQADAFVLAYDACVVDSDGEPCLDGVALAQRLGCAIPEAAYHAHEPKADARLVAEVGLIPIATGRG